MTSLKWLRRNSFPEYEVLTRVYQGSTATGKYLQGGSIKGHSAGVSAADLVDEADDLPTASEVADKDTPIEIEDEDDEEVHPVALKVKEKQKTKRDRDSALSRESSMELSDTPSSKSRKKDKMGQLEKFSSSIIHALNAPVATPSGPTATL